MFKLNADYIYKLDIPFENITTSSFLVMGDKIILVDCGTYPSDVTEIIMPALKKLKITPDYLFLTHSHGDHAGGTEVFLGELKNLKLICFHGEMCKKFGGTLLSNNQELINGICFLSLPGHSYDSGALFDKRTKSLITGDCLQLWGITKYGCGVGLPIEYKKSIFRLKNIKINNIFASHEYYPFGSTALGSNAVKDYLYECDDFYNEIILFTLGAKGRGEDDFDKIAADFRKEKSLAHPKMPIIPPHCFKAISASDEELIKRYICQ